MKRKISILRRTDQRIEFCFGPGTEVLLGVLDRYSLTVLVAYGGECWDILFDNDASPQKIAGGHICKPCLPEFQKIHASREALWRDHLFDPLLHWINKTLATAESVVLYGNEDISSAKLLQEGETDPEAVKIIRLQGQESKMAD